MPAQRPTLDISSDLEELGRTPVAVVCAGPKAILDVPATLEYLETRGVPVVAVGQEELPGFYARSSGIPAPHRVAGRRGGGRRWSRPTSASGSAAGVLVCVPVPADGGAARTDVARDAVERAVARSRRGRDRTARD